MEYEMQAMFFPRTRSLGLGVLCFLAGSVAFAGEPAEISGFGTPMASDRLAESRGGFDMVKNDMQLSGLVANNAAINVMSGSNFITDGAFANASGLPTVIQNSGSNVLIQNATIVNVQFQ